MDTHIRERFTSLDTAAVSDALDSLGFPSGVGGPIAATIGSSILGPARTAALEPRQAGAAGAHILTSVVDASEPGDVIVIDNAGRTDVSSWGGILGLGARNRGVSGVLIDGAFRDVEENRSHGLAVYARSATPATARGRLQQRSAGEPVTVFGRSVREGDVVFADATGLVIIPAQHLFDVLEAAEATVAREKEIAAEVRSGKSLEASMRDARLAGHEEK